MQCLAAILYQSVQASAGGNGGDGEGGKSCNLEKNKILDVLSQSGVGLKGLKLDVTNTTSDEIAGVGSGNGDVEE